MSVRDVETELVGLAGHLAAGTCRYLALLAEFDTRDGWAGPGLRSCAHWLNWRVGTDLRTARDHLRVAHALTDLPATTAAFAAGRISYSKVRALTRIATPTNEQILLGVALHGTAAQLDELVRAARTGADPRTPTAQRGLHHRRDTDGSLLVHLRIPPGRAEQFLAAITAELDAGHNGSAGCLSSRVGRSSQIATVPLHDVAMALGSAGPSVSGGADVPICRARRGVAGPALA